ncbi:unnamed protein product [Cuscuta epithymum]|uniref:Uncharacterized protein n=1 Tax=Cuscuta epithymum TaxID=186058 RepID=A0AAV0DT93_9ASTE|nr:unnamed protein product [Cuscuta epithymum]
MGLIWYGDGMSQSPFISISGFNILRIPQPVILSLNQFKSHFLFIQFIFISDKLNITMEIGKEQVGSSSSSLTEDLSAPKDSSQSPGIFSLLFPPLVRRPSSNSSSYLMECLDKQLYEFQAWKKESQADDMINSANCDTTLHDRSTPSPLSSSVYYSSKEDMYIKPRSAQSMPKKEYDPKGNNSQSVSQGNWWDGSVYY